MYSTATVDFFEKLKAKAEKDRDKAILRGDQMGAFNLKKKIIYIQEAIDALVKVGMMP